ncbi:MAG TPA: DEAD/DEAH box helicase [Longimicrobium sp.]
MIVLHACWSHPTLRVWGESEHRRVGVRRRAANHPPSRPWPHPFAAEWRELHDALERVGLIDWKDVARQDLTLRIPSYPRSPQPSPQAHRFDSIEAGEGLVGSALWTMPAVYLSGTTSRAMDFLLALPAGAPQGVVIGDTLRGMAEVAKLALELVARGRVLPVLERPSGRGWTVGWRPVLTDPADEERFAVLARALPGACWAAEPAREDDGVAGLLATLVDRCVRQALVGSRVVPPRKVRRSAAEWWLIALTDRFGAFSADAHTVEPLANALAAWSRSIVPPGRGGVRTCFFLAPPAGAADDGATPDDPWQLDFLLQSVDDPSLMVTAEEVWRSPGPIRVLRSVADPQERLIADLGRAMRLFPPLEPALRTPHPTRAELTAEEAFRFLREGAPLLSQAGFAVRVPPWWNRPAARLGVKLRARPAVPRENGPGRFGLDAIVAYDWEVSLGGASISAEEFRALAGRKVPLVRFRGEWVELKPSEVEAALRIFDRHATGEMTAAQLLRLAAGAEEVAEGLPLSGVEAEGWLGELLAGAGDAQAKPVPTPAGFNGKLRPYQRRGVGWLAFLDRIGVGACLADDMGLGKTPQTLALLVKEREGRGKKHLPATLLVCPMSLVGNWQRESARFAPGLKVHVHHGAERLSGAALQEAVRGSDLVLTTYALAARDRDELASVEWGRVVLDEAQNVKNAAARQSQAVRAFRTPRRIALTGTPVENRLAELWSILDFLNPGLLGPLAGFRRRFATPIERFHDAERAAELQRLTRPFILRRLKTDRRIIRDLPEKHEMRVFCNLTREQASLYQATVDEMLARIEASEGIERRGLVLATLTRLKQVCNHPAHLLRDGSALEGRSGKVARLEEILEEVLELGDRALVFTQFAEMGHLLRGHLEARFGSEVPFLHGATSKTARDTLVARFQEGDGPSILLLSLKAGGTGLNLTAANHVIHFDRWWNPAVEDQATDRAFRIGQRRDVQVRKLVCAGTLEERIDAMIEEKKQLAESVLGAGEAWLTELSTAQLRQVVALAADAVSE